MPVVRRIADRGDSKVGNPLRITDRAVRPVKGGVRAPSIRVKCGCCSEAFVISFDAGPTMDPHVDTLEINGVAGTIDQWRQIFLPLLQIEDPTN